METRPRSAELDGLEQQILQLKIEFERFFHGDLDIPPNHLREQIRRRILLLRNGSRKSHSDNFLLNALEARFQAYSEMFNRRLRNHETHGGRRPPVATTVVDPAKGVVFGDHFDPELVKPLYQRLYGPDSGNQSVAPETFTTYLARQHELIRSRTGCNKVRFRVVEEDGRSKLKARAEKESTS
jgi:hypothetical protein